MDIIFFIYGMAFVILGFVILIRKSHESELDFGNILWILSSFAFSHGFLEWTDFWKIIRGDHPVLHIIQPFLLLISYLFLFEFGRKFLILSYQNSSYSQKAEKLLGIWLYIPLLGSILLFSVFSNNSLQMLTVMSRYAAGIPGAFFTGFAFRFYWYRRLINNIYYSDKRIIKAGFKIAGLSFMAYGIFGGLIVPEMDWFPASLINQTSFFDFFRIPVQVFRTASAILISVSMGFILTIFNVEIILRMKNNITQINGALNELKRMSRLNDMILGSAAEGIFGLDLKGNALFINETALKILGYSHDELIGKPIHAFIHSSDNGNNCDEKSCRIISALQHQSILRISDEIFYKKNGERIPVEFTCAPLREVDESHGVVIAFQDLTEFNRVKNENMILSYYDTLTQLPNRKLLTEQITRALAGTSRNDKSGALFFIDIDNFNSLNDTLGHSSGDQLLQTASRRLTEIMRDEDTVARFGGDEFVVMIEDLSTAKEEAAKQARHIAEKILKALSHTYLLGDYEHTCTNSIGITIFSGQEDSPEELLKQADLAMHNAKKEGRNCISFFDVQMQKIVQEQVSMESEMRNSIRSEDFIIHYQPQVDDQEKITGAEALIRWNNPLRGSVMPGHFIPIAEETGLIIPISNFVFENVCRHLAEWKTIPHMSHITVSVNISEKQFNYPDFIKDILQIVESTNADPAKIKFEITENHLLRNPEKVIEKLTYLKSLGFGISLDDFGTGFSSLTYLKKLPVDQIKIDRSFVHDVLNQPNDASIIRAIIALSKSMKLDLIAEGVETIEQKNFLLQEGCRSFQGYLYGKPMLKEDLERFAGEEKLSENFSK